MSKKAGTLLWRRMRAQTHDGVIDCDTGITQVDRSFADMSPGEPPLGVTSASPPAPGTTPASRIQVIPLAPLSAWFGVTHSEPYYDPATGTIHVQFSAGVDGVVNVLFWDPHSLIGPGDADTYNAGG